MQVLRAPVDALRRVVKHRLALRRALPAEEVDAEAAKRFWLSISPTVRLEILRFTDSSLVQKIHASMIKLLKMEMWNQMNGITDEEQEPMDRLAGFEFEAPAERDCMGSLQAPIAIMATPGFVQGDGLLKDLELRLGSTLLEGRPALQKEDWSTVFDTEPRSWTELQGQIFRLIELAIVHAERDPYYQLLLEEEVKAEALVRTTKRKAKRKPNPPRSATAPATGAAASDEHQEEDSEEQLKTAEQIRLDNDDEEETKPAQEEEEAFEEDEEVANALSVGTAVSKPRLADLRNEGCFQWLPDIFADTSEWQMECRKLQHQSTGLGRAEAPVARAFVKNTFVEVELLDESKPAKPERRRSTSLILRGRW
eukprot:TRINITY_DN64592_c0_g1_i1.p1 TRINITY_DN64592_c0_g1~~TRINITY_DN64592_c0_g1_i1.p1  ORF type:complete len:386 (-),score=96.20 TRINITY_DN64592_c0_g1_i1:19-1119(-)